MNTQKTEQDQGRSRLRRPFVAVGAVVGLLVSVWYVAGNLRRAVPDPIWLRFLNVFLIIFVAIYLANLLRRLVEKVGRR